MNIANLGAFGAGLVRGDILADEERRKDEDQAFQLEQRKAWRDEQARLERVRQGIAGVARPGAEVGRVPMMAPGMDGEEAIPGLYNVQRQTDAGYYGQLGDVYAREGMIAESEGMRDRARTRDQQTRGDAALAARREMLKMAQTDLPGFMQKFGTAFNNNQWGGAHREGDYLAMASTPQGQVAHYFNKAGQMVGTIPVTPESITQLVNQLTDDELSTVSPEMYGAATTRGIQRGQLGAQQTSAQAAMRTAAANEGYKDWLTTKPVIHQDGTGRLISLSADGTRQLGVFGSARPEPQHINSRDQWVAFGTDADNTPILYNPTKVDPRNPAAAFVRMDGKPVQDLQKVYKKISGEGTQPELKLVKTSEGDFFADPAGRPVARPDAAGQFQMIPFGVDPRADKKWKDTSGKMANAGASLTVVQNRAGNLQWAYQSADGRKWSTPQEALNPPREGVKLTPDAQARVAAGETASIPSPGAPAPIQIPQDTPAAPAQGLSRNPYVDAKGRPTGARVAGDDKSIAETTIVPAAQNAARAVGTAVTGAGDKYLAQRVADSQKPGGKPLTAMEQVQARRAGLIK